MSAHEASAPRVTALLAGVLARAESAPETDPNAEERTITLGALIESLDERAYGLAILILALPCAVPFLYGIPQIVALPMLALAAQLAAGREHPWLPRRLAERRVKVRSLKTVVDRAQRSLGFVERLAVPRFKLLSDGPGARVVGGLMLIPAASILLPFPLTNTMPGIGVGITAVGLLERDGLLIIAGLAVGLLWVLALVFLGAEAISAIKGVVLGR